MLNNSRLLLIITISFSLGIFILNFITINLSGIYWILTLNAILLMTLWSNRIVRAVGLSIIFFLLGIIYPHYVEKIFTVNDHLFLVKWLDYLRNLYTISLNEVLAYPQSSLASGLVLGIKSSFPQDLKQAFINTGTIHIVAVSGFNITIMLKIFADWLKYFGRFFSFFGGTVVIVLFIILVGGQASVVRAGIMGWLFLLAKFIHRLPSIRNALFVTAFLMILQEPAILVKDIGFQLSFLSMLGLVYISPIIRFYFKKMANYNKLPKLLRGSLTETLSAQMAVNLLILGHFGRLSLVAIITNLLIVPIIPIPMIGGIFIGALGIIGKTAISYLAIPLDLVLRYILKITEIFNKIPFASLEFGKLNWWIVLFGYITAIVLLRIIYLKLPKNIFYEE